MRAAAGVPGLESLVIAARSAPPVPEAGAGTLEAAIVTVWSDLSAMSRAVADEGGFLMRRLGVPITVSATERYDLVSRTFAALPRESSAFLRILSARAPSADEPALVATLQRQQRRLVDLGIIASHLGSRRLDDGAIEVVHVSVWPDRATVRSATHGLVDRPIFAAELEAWQGSTRVEMYDAIEIAPRLSPGIGPPLVVVDEDRRIVDVTSTAATVLGGPPVELIGRRLDELARGEDAELPDLWQRMLQTGGAMGSWVWSVPDIGAVLVNVAAGRDIPVPGRHALLVRRRDEPAPTLVDVESALAVAFPRTGAGVADH